MLRVIKLLWEKAESATRRKPMPKNAKWDRTWA